MSILIPEPCTGGPGGGSLDPDLVTIAAIDSTGSGVMGSEGSGWEMLSFPAVKTAMSLDNVDNTSDVNKPVSTAQATALASKADLVGGVIPSAQLPALAFTTVVPVASQAAMLALTSAQVQPGDVATRSDGAGTFMLTDPDPSLLAHWTLLNAPTDVVVSVNGFTGTVVLAKGNIGLGNVDNTSDANKPVSTAQAAAIALKADLASPALTGVPTAPTAAGGTNTTQIATTSFVVTALASAGGVSSDASFNTKGGTSALSSLTTGADNSAFGYQAGKAITSGSNNTAVGYNALIAVTTSSFNTAVGASALVANTSGASNTAVGYQALASATTGGSNTSLGMNSLANTTTGTGNVAAGVQALQANLIGLENTALGYRSLASALNNFNTAVGAYALNANTSAVGNVAVGHSALTANSTGVNTAVGYQALKANTTASNNTALGYQALLVSTTGAGNTAVGDTALTANTTGSNNTALGYQSLAGATSNNNTAVGALALQSVTTGQKNTAVGRWANRGITTVSNTTTLGSDTVASAAGSTAIGIDSAGNPASTATTDEMKLGTALTTVYAGKDIRTADPGTGAAVWQLGSTHAAAVALDTANYVEVRIAGTVVKLAIVV